MKHNTTSLETRNIIGCGIAVLSVIVLLYGMFNNPIRLSSDGFMGYLVGASIGMVFGLSLLAHIALPYKQAAIAIAAGICILYAALTDMDIMLKLASAVVMVVAALLWVKKLK